ncbi:MAG: glycosyltransferase [Phycisphaerales bacterium]|nr:MAG: glycosyltransferase [Phycisphaerales bacterium]
MTHVGHLFDGSAGWEQRVGVSQLIDGLPRDRYVNSLIAIDPAAGTSLRWLKQPVDLLPRFYGIASLAAPVVARFVAQQRIDVIHAWGIGAAVPARALPRIPLVVQLFDPSTAVREVKRVRALARPSTFAVACGSEIVRRRLIEGGLDPELAVVIRPGVDFSLINRCRRGSLREELGLTWDESVAIVPEPVTRAGGQFDAAYAVAIHHHLSGGTRVIVPGTSREQRRISRFTDTLPLSSALVMPGDRHPFEELLAVSDVLLVTPRGDISTTSIAWAMAAGVAVIGTAVHSIAEMIASNVNGLLFKQVPAQSMIASIIGLLQDRASQEKTRETARGQAYEVFGLRRYVEQTARLYENVLSRAAPGEGITDSAIDI